jgi:hypothetical protein
LRSRLFLADCSGDFVVPRRFLILNIDRFPDAPGILNFVYAYVGAEDRLLDYAERAFEAGRFAEVRYFFNPVYSPARKTERYKTLVRNVGLVDYWKPSRNLQRLAFAFGGKLFPDHPFASFSREPLFYALAGTRVLLGLPVRPAGSVFTLDYAATQRVDFFP